MAASSARALAALATLWWIRDDPTVPGAAIGFVPEAMAVKEGRAITKTNRDGGDIQPSLTSRAKGVAVIGSVGWIGCQGWDHISKRPKCPA